jgi:endonuclease YncB( thermonuclease family)
MGCFNSKNQEPVANNDRVGRARALNPVFIPGTYDYVGLDETDIDELMNADRSVQDISIRNFKTWAKIVYAYDGDSCHIVIKYRDDPTHLGKLIKLKCRVHGIDTPELRTKNPLEKEHAIRARDRFIELIKDRLIWVNVLNDDDDKYGRYLVKFFMDSDEEFPIDKILIAENYGYEYYGDKKKEFEEWYEPLL